MARAMLLNTEAYTKYLKRIGFIQGCGSMCDFELTVHGDDFLVEANEEQLRWLNKKMQDAREIKCQVMVRY